MCLVICEGKYDTIFLKEILDDISDISADTYTGKRDDRLYQQQDYMESFQYRTEEVLIKGDGGKSFQLQIYKNQLLNFGRIYSNHFLLWDLDGSEPRNKFETYEENLENHFKPNQPVKLEMSVEDENELFYSIFLTGRISDFEFETPVIAFKSNLEEEADINKERDGKEEKEGKTRNLANEERVQDFVKSKLVERIG